MASTLPWTDGGSVNHMLLGKGFTESYTSIEVKARLGNLKICSEIAIEQRVTYETGKYPVKYISVAL